MKIIHLTQMHHLPFGIKATQEYIDICLNSQLAIADFIVQHENAPVVLEGLTENCEGDPGLMRQAFQMMFPNGFPKVVNALNPLQKEAIYSEGAVRTLHYLNLLRRIYRSIHPEVSATLDDEISDEISKGSFQKIFKEREEEAMLCIDEIVVAKQPEFIILVYGGAHDFSSYCAKRGYEYQRIETSSKPVLEQSHPRSTSRSTSFFPSTTGVMSQPAFSGSNVAESDTVVGQAYPIPGSNLSIQFERSSIGEDMFVMRLMFSGHRENSMHLDKKLASVLISHLNSPKELISLMKTKGKTMTDMANFIESHLDFNSASFTAH